MNPSIGQISSFGAVLIVIYCFIAGVIRCDKLPISSSPGGGGGGGEDEVGRDSL